jgi:hypothetical protein
MKPKAPISRLNGLGKRNSRNSLSILQRSGKWRLVKYSLLGQASIDSGADIDWDNPNDPGVVLNACAEDIVKLWNNPTVKELLSQQKIRLEDMSGL